jgi:hypothetical protein
VRSACPSASSPRADAPADRHPRRGDQHPPARRVRRQLERSRGARGPRHPLAGSGRRGDGPARRDRPADVFEPRADGGELARQCQCAARARALDPRHARLHRGAQQRAGGLGRARRARGRGADRAHPGDGARPALGRQPQHRDPVGRTGRGAARRRARHHRQRPARARHGGCDHRGGDPERARGQSGAAARRGRRDAGDDRRRLHADGQCRAAARRPLGPADRRLGGRGRRRSSRRPTTSTGSPPSASPSGP